jgi:Pyruvate/2-oxoacid:ferredoxin oxidoreductase delta subunit
VGEEIYRQLCAAMSKRGTIYPAMDIPEFYDIAKELFTPEEAAVACSLHSKPSTAAMVAKEMGRPEEEIGPILETMANKAVCSSFEMAGVRYYTALPFVPGIFELQLMRGTRTDRDRRLARLIHDYKQAVDKTRGPRPITFPGNRVIPVEKTIQVGTRVHTYRQISSFVDRSDPISVSTCYCRHEAKLLDEKDDCGKPDKVCMQFGLGAKFAIERGIARKINRDEAKEILKMAAEAGLVHASLNIQEIDFVCNCCACHSIILKPVLKQPKPASALYSGFQPHIDPGLCTACGTCVDRCPAKALTLMAEVPEINMDRCIGCGVCATGCPVEAIAMVERPGIPVPPKDRKELRQALESHK